jgi:hypothetical protein
MGGAPTSLLANWDFTGENATIRSWEVLRFAQDDRWNAPNRATAKVTKVANVSSRAAIDGEGPLNCNCCHPSEVDAEICI